MRKLRSYRLRAGLRQIDVADKLDVDQSAVSHWEAGTIPCKKYRVKLAALYGVTVEDLMAKEETQGDSGKYQIHDR